MLKSGLYEQVINKEILEKINEDIDRIKITSNIDKEEASKILSKYIEDVIEKALKNIKETHCKMKLN